MSQFTAKDYAMWLLSAAMLLVILAAYHQPSGEYAQSYQQVMSNSATSQIIIHCTQDANQKRHCQSQIWGAHSAPDEAALKAFGEDLTLIVGESTADGDNLDAQIQALQAAADAMEPNANDEGLDDGLLDELASSIGIQKSAKPPRGCNQGVSDNHSRKARLLELIEKEPDNLCIEVLLRQLRHEAD